MPKAKHRVALLIDCDNVSHSHLDWILEQAAKEGNFRIRRAYGDFNGSRLQGWLNACQSAEVETFQATAHVKGKNSSDIALTIDAMDLLHGGETDLFCIATNDSDFSQLAMRLQASGKTVVGIVKKESSGGPFANRCSRTIALPGKAPKPAPAAKSKPASAGQASSKSQPKSAPVPKKKLQPASDWVPRVAKLVRDLSKGGDCPSLQKLDSAMRRASPPIDYKSFRTSQTRKRKRLIDMLDAESDTFRLIKGDNGTVRVCLTNATRRTK